MFEMNRHPKILGPIMHLRPKRPAIGFTRSVPRVEKRQKHHSRRQREPRRLTRWWKRDGAGFTLVLAPDTACDVSFFSLFVKMTTRVPRQSFSEIYLYLCAVFFCFGHCPHRFRNYLLSHRIYRFCFIRVYRPVFFL